MHECDVETVSDSWRVIVVTNVPGGMIYKKVDQAVRSLGHRVVGVLTTPGPKRRRSNSYLDVVAAVSPGVDVLVSNHPERWAAMLAPLQPDLIICGGMPWLLPEDLVALPRLGAINLHPALLPRYRGPYAIEWGLRNGDPEAGFTAHWIGPEFDTGAILSQVSFPIGDDDDIDALLGRFGEVLPELIVAALERVATGDPGDPQDESQATYAGLFEDSWRQINWQEPARVVHNQVRSWTGVRDIPKGAIAEVDGERLLIFRTRLAPDLPAAANGATPGTVVQRDDQRLVVQCGDGPLVLLAWEPVAIGAD
jgi:methionyl-tRNA formyltransferase